MAKKKIVILGAGLAGLSAAWHLQKKGLSCHIFEKEAEAGGLCRSKKIGGFTFDCDGHLLHFTHRYTFDLIRSLLKGNLCEHRKNSWIYSHGKYTRYPFQANLYGLPSAIIKECLSGFIEASRNGHLKKPSNFMNWIDLTFGAGIAKHFMVPYNTKFWTASPDQMNCDWLDGFIPVPSLNRIIDGTIQENKEPLGYNAHFWYPIKGGIGEVARCMRERIKNIHTQCEAIKIDLARKQVIFSSGEKENYDYLVCTVPLPEIKDLIKDLPQGIASSLKKLRWNSILNINLGINQDDRAGRHWIYFPEKKFTFFRIGFYSSFSPHLAPKGSNSLYVEIAYSKEKPIDKNGIMPRIEEELETAGILTSKQKIRHCQINDIKYGYPIYDKNYISSREKIIDYLSRKSILPCGRYGSWRYFSMEGAILDAKRVADLLF